MANKIKVQPTSGKYLSVSVDGKNYDVYLVDPRTGEQGTEIPREIAIKLMSAKHSLISVVPVIKDGKFVQQLTSDELSMIDRLKNNPEEANEIFEERKKNENSTLEALVKTQATQIQMMMEQMNELKEQIKSSKKSSKKSSDKTEE